MRSIIVTIIGRDRPRILADVASIIADVGGNIEDIRGHTMFIERGKKIANISMIITGENIGAIYQKLREKLQKFAEENKLVIQIYPVDHFIEEKEEIPPFREEEE